MSSHLSSDLDFAVLSDLLLFSFSFFIHLNIFKGTEEIWIIYLICKLEERLFLEQIE